MTTACDNVKIYWVQPTHGDEFPLEFFVTEVKLPDLFEEPDVHEVFLNWQKEATLCHVPLTSALTASSTPKPIRILHMVQPFKSTSVKQPKPPPTSGCRKAVSLSRPCQHWAAWVEPLPTLQSPRWHPAPDLQPPFSACTAKIYWTVASFSLLGKLSSLALLTSWAKYEKIIKVYELCRTGERCVYARTITHTI